MKPSPIFIGVAIAAVLIAAMWTATVQRVGFETRSALAAAERANSNLAIAYEENTLHALEQIEQVLNFVSGEYYAQGIGVAGSMRRLPLNRDLIRSVAVTDVAGNVVFSEASTTWNKPSVDFRRLDPASARDKVAVGRPWLDPASERWSMMVSREIQDKDGSVAGIAIAEVDPAHFARFFRSAPVGPHGMIVLAGMDGMARVRHVAGKTSYGDDMTTSTLLRMAAQKPAGSFISLGTYDGRPRLVNYRRVPDHDLVIMVGVDPGEAIAPVRERATRYYRLAALATVLILLSAAGIGRSVARQREQLRALSRAQGDLRRSEAYTKAVTESMAAGVYTLAPDGTILSANPAAGAMHGVAASALVGRNVLDMTDPADRGLVSATIAELGKRKTQYREKPRDFLAIGSDGRPFEVECLVSGFPHQSGFTHVAIIQDISARKRMVRELRDSEARFRATFNQALIGIAHVGLDRRFRRVNQRFCEMLGYAQSEMVGRLCTDVSHPEHVASMVEMLGSLVEGEGPGSYRATRRYLRKDGGVIWGLASVTLIRDADGQPDYFLSMIQDITELKRVEQTKNEFVSTVSHELRTPLTSIRGSLGLLTGGVAGPLPVAARKLVDIALGNSERLIRLVNDILDIEKMASGKMRFELARVDIAALLPAVIAANEGFAREHGVTLWSPAAGALYAAVDRDRLEQALTNLISNAVKYSHRGDRVEVELIRAGGRARIEVRDHGPGIPPEFRSRIFHKFSQADGSDARRKSGTGLGLCIAKGIAERMGGDVGYDTKLGEGTTFFIDLPAESEPAPQANAALEA